MILSIIVRILPDKSLCLGILLVRFFITLSLEATK